MTISSENNRITYSGNAVTTAFSFPYKFIANADLDVYLDGTLKTITTHYTVTGAGEDAGGTVTFLSAPASGTDNVVILGNPSVLQDLDLVENDPLPAESLEDAFDRQTTILRRHKDLLDRAFVLPDADVSGASVLMPTPEADKVISWNSDASALHNVALVATGSLAVSSYIETLLNDADATEAQATLGLVIGTNVQAYDALLASLAGQTVSANMLQAYSASDTASLVDLTKIIPLYIGGANGLIITTNTTNPTYQVDIDCTEVLLKTTGGVPYLATSVNLTVDITASGANGLDTGTEANSTWYYLWVIYNNSTVSGLISTSSTTPTMPSGYTYKALVGAVRNNASGNFLAFTQYGKFVTFNTAIVDVDTSSQSTTGVNYTITVPPLSMARVACSGFEVSQPFTMYVLPTSSTDQIPPGDVGSAGFVGQVVGRGATGSDSVGGGCELDVRADTNSQIRMIASASISRAKIITHGFCFGD